MTDPSDIVNWRRLDARVTTSGQPTTTQLAAIADLGVGHVINLGLHTHARALADERGDVERLGMKYTHTFRWISRLRPTKTSRSSG